MKMKNKDYWIKRDKEFIELLDKKDNDLHKKLETRYKKMTDNLEKEIAAYYQKYGDDNVIEYRNMLKKLPKDDIDTLFKDMERFRKQYPEYEHLLPISTSMHELNRMQGLSHSIQLELLELGAMEQSEMDKHLMGIYREQYGEIMNELGVGGVARSFNREVAKLTIYDKWVDGANFSDRIWKNKDRLAGFIREELTQGIIRGDSYNKMIKTLRERTGVGSREARRLVWTESSFVLNQAHKQPYEELGIVKYEINAVMDRKTSDICKEMDGKQFRFDKSVVGKNFPPFHPNCRSTFITASEALESDDLREQIMNKNENTFENVPNGDIMKEEMQSILGSMTDDELRVYDELQKFAPYNNYNYGKGGAHYNPGMKKINMDITNDMWNEIRGIDRKGNFKVKFHEEFHQLDFVLGNTKFAKHKERPKTYASSMTDTNTMRGQMLYEAIENDLKKYADNAIDWARGSLSPNVPYIKNLNRTTADQKKALHFYMVNHGIKSRKEKVSASMFTDSIGGLSNGNIDIHKMGFVGHSSKYYKSHGKDILTKEAWAEFGAYKFDYTKEEKKKLKELMPETLEVSESIFSDIAEYLKTETLEYK